MPVIKTLNRMKTPSRARSISLSFEGATHAFDEIEAQDWRVRYDPGLAERAHRMYADFLRARPAGLRPFAERPCTHPLLRARRCERVFKLHSVSVGEEKAQ